MLIALFGAPEQGRMNTEPAKCDPTEEEGVEQACTWDPERTLRNLKKLTLPSSQHVFAEAQNHSAYGEAGGGGQRWEGGLRH